MRLVIWLTGLIIASAINPKQEISIETSVCYILFGIVIGYLDFTEFKQNGTRHNKS